MLLTIVELLSNNLTIFLLIGYIFALWAALVIWTWFDASDRTNNALYRFGAVILVATGAFLGFAIYLLLRPNTTRQENYMKDLEEAILTSQASLHTCHNCFAVIKEEYTYCTNCAAKLQTTCQSCQRDINRAWSTCPYCGYKRQEAIPEGELKEKAVVATEEVKNKKIKKGAPAFFSTIVNYLRAARNERKSKGQKKSARASSRRKTRKSKRTLREEKS